MKRFSILLAMSAIACFVFAEPREIRAQPDEKILLSIEDTALVAGFRIKLMNVHDDGCGTKRECYWSQYCDATFHIWQNNKDLGEITLSRASREDSRMSARMGEWYMLLYGVDGYEVETPTATFKITKTLD